MEFGTTQELKVRTVEAWVSVIRKSGSPQSGTSFVTAGGFTNRRCISRLDYNFTKSKLKKGP